MRVLIVGLLLVASPALGGDKASPKALALKGVSLAQVAAARAPLKVAAMRLKGQDVELRCQGSQKAPRCALTDPKGKALSRSAKLSASADKASVRVQGEAIGGARWADATGHYDFMIPTTGLVDTDFIFGVARSGGR